MSACSIEHIDATLQPQISAVARCPGELWYLFVYTATDLWRVHWGASGLENSELGNEGIVRRVDRVNGERRKSLDTLLSAVLVCRSWHTVFTPLLLKWVRVQTAPALSDVVSLLQQPFGNGLKGALVKRLVIDIEVVELAEEEMSTGIAIIQDIIQVLHACCRLEQFAFYGFEKRSYSKHGIIPALLGACGDSLRILTSPTYYLPDSFDVIRLFTNFPRLSELELGVGNLAVVLPSTGDLGSGPCNLQSLRWYITDDNASFLYFFASLDMSQLRKLAIVADGMAAEREEINPVNIATGIEAILLSHGPKLLSFEVDMSFPAIEGWPESPFLDLCPNLEELIWDFLSGELRPPVAPHNTLRRVGCHNFFDNDPAFHSGPAQAMHIAKALRTISTLCSNKLPKLKVIRCLDLQPSDGITRSIQSSWGQFPDEYRVFAGKAANTCGLNNVRFEDCLGELVVLDFAPLAYIYYPDHEVVLEADGP